MKAGTGLTGQEPFEVHADLGQRCLFITMRGRWTADIFAHYAAALTASEAEMKSLHGTTYTLCDGRDFPLQEPAIAERFAPLTASLRIPETRRTAIVMAQLIDRAQARDAAEIVNARYFRSIESARDWLFSDEA